MVEYYHRVTGLVPSSYMEAQLGLLYSKQATAKGRQKLADSKAETINL
jgi:hypothetical protein